MPSGRPWTPPPEACEAALAFFEGMFVPEYRVGEAGFFGAAGARCRPDAGPLDRLLGFAGRDPGGPPADRERPVRQPLHA